MFARLLIAVLVIGAVVVFLRGLRARAGEKRTVVSARTARCAHCQVYFPRQEGVVVDGRDFCSREHAEQGRA
ncbi:MAG: PP0621 family protein [Gammaproteobacteria bacterium]